MKIFKICLLFFFSAFLNLAYSGCPYPDKPMVERGEEDGIGYVRLNSYTEGSQICISEFIAENCPNCKSGYDHVCGKSGHWKPLAFKGDCAVEVNDDSPLTFKDHTSGGSGGSPFNGPNEKRNKKLAFLKKMKKATLNASGRVGSTDIPSSTLYGNGSSDGNFNANDNSNIGSQGECGQQTMDEISARISNKYGSHQGGSLCVSTKQVYDMASDIKRELINVGCYSGNLKAEIDNTIKQAGVTGASMSCSNF